MLRLGFVGTGWWGMELGKAARTLPEQIAIAGCHSLSAEECAAFRDTCRGRIFPSYEAMLAEPTVDGVVLATPHALHWQQVIAAAQAGKHVFVEKPLALDIETAARAIAACETHSVILAVGHNRRYSEAAQRMRALVEAGALGRILHVEANYSSPGALRYRPGQWRAQREQMPAGGIAPMGLHMIDTLTWLLGPIAKLAAIAKRQAVAVDIDDTTATLFELASGVTGTLGCIFATPLTSYLRIYGTEANLIARDNFAALDVEPADASRPRTRDSFPHDRTLQAELRAFVESCLAGAVFPVRPIEALHNVAVMEAIALSAANNGIWVQVTRPGPR